MTHFTVVPRPQAKMQNMFWFHLHKHDDLIIIFVIYDGTLNLFSFACVCVFAIWMRHLEQWVFFSTFWPLQNNLLNNQENNQQ